MSRRQLAAAALAGAIALGFWLWPGAETAAPGGSTGQVPSEAERTTRGAPTLEQRHQDQRHAAEAEPRSGLDVERILPSSVDAARDSVGEGRGPDAGQSEAELYSPDAGAAAIAAFERCHFVDGDPSATERSSIIIEVRGPGPWEGVLTATMVMTPDAYFHAWATAFPEPKSWSISRQRAAILDCDGVPLSVRLKMTDGRIAEAITDEQHRIVFEPAQPFHILGRLVFEGRAAPDLAVRSYNAAATSGRDGRFDLVISEVDAGTVETLVLMSSESWRMKKAPVVPVRPGTTVDLGDVEIKRTLPVTAGKIGVVWDAPDAGLTVLLVTKNSPAERAGLQVGDAVVEVDGVAVTNVADAMRLIPGAPGTTVRLKIRRGAEYLLVDVVRQTAD